MGNAVSRQLGNSPTKKYRDPGMYEMEDVDGRPGSRTSSLGLGQMSYNRAEEGAWISKDDLGKQVARFMMQSSHACANQYQPMQAVQLFHCVEHSSYLRIEQDCMLSHRVSD